MLREAIVKMDGRSRAVGNRRSTAIPYALLLEVATLGYLAHAYSHPGSAWIVTSSIFATVAADTFSADHDGLAVTSL